MNVINEIGALPTRNHRDVQFEGAKDISAEAMHEPRKTDGKPNLVTNQACFGCTIACGRISQDRRDALHGGQQAASTGAHRAGSSTRPPGRSGAANGVNDLEALTYANFLCNEDGFDPISFGATVGAVMELYEMGVLNEGAARHRSAVRLGQGADLLRRDDGQGRGLRQGDRAGLEAPVREVRPSRTVDERSRARSSRPTTRAASRAWAWPTPPPTAAPATCAATPSRREVLGIPVKTDPLVTDGKAGPGQGVPGRHRGLRLAPASACSPPSPGRCRTCSRSWRRPARATGRWRTWPSSASASGTWSASSTLAAGFTAKDDTLPQAAADRAGQDRPGQGQGQRAGQDAAGVLRGARLGPRTAARSRETRKRLGL